MRWRRALVSLTVIALVAASGACSSGSDDRSSADGSAKAADGASRPPPDPKALRPQVAGPPDQTTVLPVDDAAGRAVTTSAALFRQAPVAVLAPADDLAEQARAASAAVNLGAPLLLTSTAPTQLDDVATELARLKAGTVLAFGGSPAAWAGRLPHGPAVVPAPGAAHDLATLGSLELRKPQPVAAASMTGAIAALHRDSTPLLRLDPAPPPAAGGAQAEAQGDKGGRDGPEELPATEPDDPLDDLLVLVGTDPANVAAAATARASGARVLAVADADPRADTAAITALARRPPGKVLAVGTPFGSPPRLRNRLAVAATGQQLPGGGQVLFPGRQMVALYGHPNTPVLGVLGEQPLAATVTRARRLAAQYEPLADQPVVPAFEIIATVASGAAGPDGNYAAESNVDDLRPWVDAAREAGIYVVLDVQPGRTDFLAQSRRYAELLAEPNVGLALDPEWRLGPTQRHFEQIGSVTVTEVNSVVAWLAGLTRRHHLPQKLLLLHQFRPQMISGREQLDTSHDDLAVLVHADGFGTHAEKFGTWHRLLGHPPAGLWWGWKNFYDEDTPMLTPAETLAIQPRVRFVSYQ
jgi:hypothetical protein